MKKDGTKLCKHCKTEIPAAAKVCPHCRRKQGGKLKWIIIAIVVLAVVGAASEGSESDNKGKPVAASTSISTEETAKAEESKEEIVYTQVSVSQMMDELDANAMNASDKYKDQYLEITGKLSTIDSGGRYISLLPEDDEFAIIGVQCYIQNEEQKNSVSSLNVGQTVTLRGKCTSVGEVLGYSLDIESIN